MLLEPAGIVDEVKHAGPDKCPRMSPVFSFGCKYTVAKQYPDELPPTRDDRIVFRSSLHDCLQVARIDGVDDPAVQNARGVGFAKSVETLMDTESKPVVDNIVGIFDHMIQSVEEWPAER